MNNPQTQAVIKIFTDIYGAPPWFEKPKEGQNAEEILKIWDETLAQYSVDQVTCAAYNIIKYRKKSMTFPTISHLMTELFDKDKDGDTAKRLAELQAKLAQPYVETDPVRKRCGDFRINGRRVLPGMYEDAARRVMNEVQNTFPELRNANYGPIIRKAEELGWLDSGPIVKYCCEYMRWDMPAEEKNEPVEDFDAFTSLGNCLPRGFGGRHDDN